MAAIAASAPVLIAGVLADLLTVVPVMAGVAGCLAVAAAWNLRAGHRRAASAPRVAGA
jgi:hypothetical protein